jgi:5-methylcytosine-specific restriction endonuclease McrA
MDYPKTRKEAKKQGASFYLTGLPCKHGHIALRIVKGTCVECRKLEWQRSNEKRVDYFKTSEVVKEAKRRYYERNRELVIARAQARPREEKARWQKAWKANNPDWIAASNKSRRRKHRLATPRWLTNKQKLEMRELYRIARTMTQTTGEPYVVDHIVPLRSNAVCGLHVPWNLRVITREENLRKSNQLVDTSGAA